MKARAALQGAIPMIVSAICAGASVRVVWGNFPTASTNGSVIKMPLLPLDDEKVGPYAVGFAIHETGHLVGTDFTLIRGVGLRRDLLNVFEDVRIEGERMRTLPGARHWLEALALTLLADGKLGTADPGLELASQLMNYLLTFTWDKVLGFKGLQEAGQACREVLAATLPPEVFAELEPLVLTVRHAQSTQDCADLADKVVALLTRQQQQYQDQQDQSQEQSGGNGQSNQAVQQGDGSEPTTASSAAPGHSDPDPGGDGADGVGDRGDGADNSGEGSGLQDAPESETEEAASTGADEVSSQSSDSGPYSQEVGQALGEDANAQGLSDSSEKPGNGVDPGQNAGAPRGTQPGAQSAAIAEALQELLTADSCDAGKDIGERIAEGLENTLVEVASGGGRNNSGNGGFTAAPNVGDMQGICGGQAAIQAVRSQSIALRARLEDFLQAQTRSRSSAEFAGPRVTRDAPMRLAMGDLRVFARKSRQVRSVDIAIYLLVDASWSMAGQPLELAKESALALSMAFEDIGGVELAVSMFGGPTNDQVVRVVTFGEGLRKTAGRFSRVTAGGTTPLTEGLMVAHSDLLAVNVDRRVILVLTDGQPDDFDSTSRMIRIGEKLGIEHMAIGIGSGATPQHLFATNCSVLNVQELPQAMFAMVRGALRPQRMAA